MNVLDFSRFWVYLLLAVVVVRPPSAVTETRRGLLLDTVMSTAADAPGARTPTIGTGNWFGSRPATGIGLALRSVTELRRMSWAAWSPTLLTVTVQVPLPVLVMVA